MEGEIWKDIINYEGIYKISNKGRIKANIRKGGGGIMKTNVSTGYHCVSLRKAPNEKINHFLLHRLLAVHFLENPDNLPVIDHIDRNPLNNHSPGIQGVSFNTKNNSWIAQWYNNDGKKCSKSFSIKKYGDQTKQHAINKRLEMESLYGYL